MSEASKEIAVVFPGQGCQRPGMGEDLCRNYREARETFEEASEALGIDVRALCFGQDLRLDLTEFAQPAILTVEIALYRVLVRQHGLSAQWFAGHSLGEYAALVAAGCAGLAEALVLVRERGRLMQEAVPAGRGGMTAVVAPGVASAFPEQALEGLAVDLANVNSPDQVVISGLKPDLERAGERLRAELGRVRLVPLRVSAPFHCRLMEPAARGLEPLLAQGTTQWRCERAARVAANVSGGFHTGQARALARALTEQITAPVRWLDNMHALLARAGRIVEVGPGRPLSGFFKALGHPIEAVIDAPSARAFRP